MTTVKLLNVPFESNYKDTVYFVNKQEQESYMNSKVVRTFEDATYQRKDNIIRVPAHIDTLYNCNYVAYTNTPYTNKTFYAFITNMEYKQDDCTLITIQTDVMQTWMFNPDGSACYTVKESFVEREHVVKDDIGLHTVPENLETGEFVCLNHTVDEELKDLQIVMGTTMDTDGKPVNGGVYNGIYSGIRYGSWNAREHVNSATDVIKMIEDKNLGAVQCVFLAPRFLITDQDNTFWVMYSQAIKAYEHKVIEKKPSITVKNNKCLTFPYRYLLVSNNNGGSAIYKYEYFTEKENGQLKFSIQGVLTPGCAIRLIPKDYKGLYVNDEEGLNLGKYPICNWNSDVYTNWLTQNSVNMGWNLTTGIAQVVGGIGMAVATGGAGAMVGGGMALSGVNAIASQLIQKHQMSFTPAQSSGNINCGDVITASETNTFHYYHMCIQEEYMKIIDDYFQMFGYKIGRVKVPEKNHRPKFWYTKTIDVNIDGAIPNNDLQKIKDCYNNGITFWKPSAEMGVYDVNNAPLIIDK